MVFMCINLCIIFVLQPLDEAKGQAAVLPEQLGTWRFLQGGVGKNLLGAVLD